MKAEQNQWQAVAEATNGIVTPANVIDAGAFALTFKYASQLDTWKGIANVGLSYIADVVDGKIARATGTSNELGAIVDAAGDKVKTAFAGTHIYNKNLASRPLLVAVAAQNITNATASVYDITRNDQPKITVSKAGKYGTFTNSLGIGLEVIGTQLAKTDEKAGRRVRAAGSIIGWGGLAVFGVRASVGYWRQARGS